ncbi:MAG: hypothetical protein JWM34_128 [Ilumatobacteraceae bacterium]|nr:hypothetical protein [Ilumatobacteraceae bacterium]
MDDRATALFVEHDGVVEATELSRGPWDPSSCHGGPVGALITRACERVDGEPNPARWQLARITIELVRPVPVGVPMSLAVTLERPGRNVSLVGASLTVADGTEVARARALRVRVDDIALGDFTPEPPFSEPGVGQAQQTLFGGDQIAFHRDAVEMAFAEGSWIEPGPISLWCRLRVPVVAGEVPSGAQRAVSTADFSNGVSAELDPTRMVFINPDLTVHLLRPPVGEWIGMQARSHYGPFGAGLAEGALFDREGRCGRSVQSLFLSER